MTQFRRVLITGAGSGIGRSFAATLAAEAEAIVLFDVDTAGLTVTAAALPPVAKPILRTVDVSNAEVVDTAMRELQGRVEALDLLINCAAILGPGEWAAQSPDDFERVLRVDLLGTANVIRAALPCLQRARGHIVNLASTAAVHGWPGLAAYSAAKFAIVGYSEAIRAELEPRGVTLSMVFPLLIDTPLLNRPGIPPILRQGRRLAPEVVVRKVLTAAARRQRRVYVPGSVRIIAALQGLAPSLLDWYGARFGLERGA